MTVGTKILFIRETPSVDISSMGQLMWGQKVRVIGDGNWVQILEIDGKKFADCGYVKFNRTKATEGYLRAEFLV